MTNSSFCFLKLFTIPQCRQEYRTYVGPIRERGGRRYTLYHDKLFPWSSMPYNSTHATQDPSSSHREGMVGILNWVGGGACAIFGGKDECIFETSYSFCSIAWVYEEVNLPLHFKDVRVFLGWNLLGRSICRSLVRHEQLLVNSRIIACMRRLHLLSRSSIVQSSILSITHLV